MRFSLVVADASRARIYAIEPAHRDQPHRGVVFDERADLVNLERRHPVGMALGDHPGTGHAPTGVGYGLDEHRQQRTQEIDRRFATAIAAQLAATVRETGVRRAVIIASPHMLGTLRPATRSLGTIVTDTIALDLTRLSTPQLHDQLSDLGLVPPRSRLTAAM